MTGNGDSRQIAEKLLVRLKTNKQTNKRFARGCRGPRLF
jgi:hypothetical protein